MSSRAWGHFLLSNNISIFVKIDIAFAIQKLASDNKIGIVLGSNVSNLKFEQHSDFTDCTNVILYMLVDNPSTNVAEVLFAGDSVRVNENGQRVDTGESLVSRLSRVQAFFGQLFENNFVKEITFHLTGDEDDESNTLVEVPLFEFKGFLLRKYSTSKGWTPSPNIRLKKSL